MSLRDFVVSLGLQLANVPNSRIVLEEDEAFVLSGTPCSFFNVWAPLTEGGDLRKVSEAASKLVPGVPCLGVTDEAWLSEAKLLDAGMRRNMSLTGMTAPSKLLPPLHPLPAELDIRRITTDRESALVGAINARAYHMPEEWFAMMATMSFWPPGTQVFIGFVGEEAVATTVVFPMDPNILYVAWVACEKQHRRKGYAGAVLRRAVECAGERSIVLHASDAGRPLYALMGFAETSRLVLLEPCTSAVFDSIVLEHACDAEAMLGVPELLLEKVAPNCSLCLKKISKRSASVCCPDMVQSPGESYVVCEKCFSAKHTHDNSGLRFVGLAPHRARRVAYHSFSLRLRNRMISYAHLPCIGRFNQANQRFEYSSYGEVYDKARRLATCLQIVLGEERTQIVCLRCHNEDFLIADAATVFADYLCGPVATSVAPSAMLAMLELTKSAALIISGKELHAVSQIVDAARLKLVIVLSSTVEKPDNWPKRTWLMSMPEALEVGKDIAPIRFCYDPAQNVRNLIFTSGSTGAPKAVMRSDEQATASSDTRVLLPQVHFLFEPMALAASRINCYNVVLNGGRVDVFDGSFDTFWLQLRISSPTWFSATPRIWNWAFSNFKSRVDELMCREGDSVETATKKAMDECCNTVFGPRCKTVQTGSALTSKEVFDWMTVCFSGKMSVFDGYGTTEAGGIATNYKMEPDVVPFLESVPEMGYFVTDKPTPRGLLWVHTKELAMGYLADSTKTRADFQNKLGDERTFFNTGDIVTLDMVTKEVHVIDRFKNFLKLSQGVFVSPESLEGIYAGSKFVEQAYVHADASWDCVLAVVVPSEQVLRNAVGDMKSSFAELCASSEAEAAVLASLHEVGNARGVSSYELPRAVLLESVRFSPDNGLMTPSFKTSRIGLRAKYARALEKKHKSSSGLEVSSLSASMSQDLTSSAILDIVGRGGAAPGASATTARSFGSVLKTFTGKDVRDFPEATVTEMGLDSCGLVMLHQAIVKQLGLRVPFAMLAAPVGELDAFVTRNQLRRLTDSIGMAGEESWEDEILLPEDLVFTKARQVAKPKHVFLTGASGFLGTYVLAKLLNDPQAIVIALVRSEARLKEAVKHYRLTVDWSRVTILVGDLSAPLFGMSEESFAQTAKSVEAVIHNGAEVNGLFEYSMLKAANVEGTKMAIRLAALGGAHLVYVSSISALAGAKEGRQDAPPLNPKRIQRVASGYGQTKRVSEHLVMAAQEKGLAAAIVRPGTIGPVGSWNDNDTITKLFRGMLQMKAAPRLYQNISAAPVDWVADVAVAAATPAARHAVLNVVGLPVDFDSLCPAELKRVPLAEFVGCITSGNALAPLLSYFDRGVFPLADDGEFASPTDTNQFVMSRGVKQCPVWTPLLEHLF